MYSYRIWKSTTSSEPVLTKQWRKLDLSSASGRTLESVHYFTVRFTDIFVLIANILRHYACLGRCSFYNSFEHKKKCFCWATAITHHCYAEEQHCGIVCCASFLLQLEILSIEISPGYIASREELYPIASEILIWDEFMMPLNYCGCLFYKHIGKETNSEKLEPSVPGKINVIDYR